MTKQKTDQIPKSEIEAKVDAMMDINSDGITDPSPKSTERIDIFAHQETPIESVQSAPLVPGVRHHADTEYSQPELPVTETNTLESTTSQGDDVTVVDVDLDTPQTTEAIDDIVAQEADEVLAAQDAGIERAIETAGDAEPEELKKSGHPLFWFFIVLLVIIAAVTAYVLTSPGLDLPFGL